MKLRHKHLYLLCAGASFLLFIVMVRALGAGIVEHYPESSRPNIEGILSVGTVFGLLLSFPLSTTIVLLGHAVAAPRR